MARITIEDCMEQVPNRFHLVRMASIRAKQLKKGARPLLTSDENKEVVMSLREIAAGLVKPGDSAPPADALAALNSPAEMAPVEPDEVVPVTSDAAPETPPPDE
ncbi:MAG: DNA-directed RNA polymerase subunit omega [bacterium]|nr:DNA-directed RNA polymerase subunit omega [bacterium]